MEDDARAGLYRRATIAALVVAPALFVVDNVLHPKEYVRGNEAQQLEAIGDAATRWQLAHFIGFLAILVFIAAVLGLGYVVGRRQPRLGLIGAVLGVLGLGGLAGGIALDGFTWGVLGNLSTRSDVDQRTLQIALEEVQTSSWSLQFYLMAAAFIVGLVMLAIGAARQGAVSWPAGGLLALAAVMTGTELAIVSNAYFIAGSLVLLAGGCAVAAGLARLSDVEFAAGGPE